MLKINLLQPEIQRIMAINFVCIYHEILKSWLFVLSKHCLYRQLVHVTSKNRFRHLPLVSLAKVLKIHLGYHIS